MSIADRLNLAPEENLVVVTRAHPVRLVRPAVIAWLTVLGYSALRRLLDLVWRPFETPWTTLHSLVGWTLTLVAVWVLFRHVLRPVWRWLRTRFVLTTHRLALTGPPVRDNAVALPLDALGVTRITAPSGVAALARGVDRATVVADFGTLGGLKLVDCPRPRTMVDLIRRQAGVRSHYSGNGMSTPTHGRFPGGPRV